MRIWMRGLCEQANGRFQRVRRNLNCVVISVPATVSRKDLEATFAEDRRVREAIAVVEKHYGPLDEE